MVGKPIGHTSTLFSNPGIRRLERHPVGADLDGTYRLEREKLAYVFDTFSIVEEQVEQDYGE